VVTVVFAKIAGGKVPDDRVIDGVDQTGFLLGKQEKSSREEKRFTQFHVDGQKAIPGFARRRFQRLGWNLRSAMALPTSEAITTAM
jgi:hypothetical protein